MLRTILLSLCLLLGVGVILSQPAFPGEDGPAEEEEKKERGTLLPRPKEDARAANWVRSLGGLRPQSFNVADGALINHTLAPKGDRFYYFREVKKNNDVTYELHTVGVGRSETRVAKTGADDTPPLFLPDERILFLTRVFDENNDGSVDLLDAPTLMSSGADGDRLKQVAILDAGDVPVAVWQDGEAVLLSTRRGESANGMIVSLNLLNGEREDVVEGFNVELVLPEDRLLIQRLQLTKEPPEKPQGRGWGAPVEPEPEEPESTPLPTLLGHAEHLIFDPKDDSVVVLHSPSQRSQIVVAGGGSYFGMQEESQKGRGGNGRRIVLGPPDIGDARFQELIVDDAQHKDTLAPMARYQWKTIGYVAEYGPLLLERGNLGAKLLLQDKALKVHVIDEFDFFAKGFQCSASGKIVGWIMVEDTDKNGKLEPWKDHAKPFIAEIR